MEDGFPENSFGYGDSGRKDSEGSRKDLLQEFGRGIRHWMLPFLLGELADTFLWFPVTKPTGCGSKVGT